MKSWDLTGKTAVVCGASEGMGRASAEMMAERGAKIIALSRTEKNLQQMVQGLAGQGHQYFAVDLSDMNAVKEKLLPFLQKQEIHILINNAGGPKGGPLHEAKVEEFFAPMQAHAAVDGQETGLPYSILARRLPACATAARTKAALLCGGPVPVARGCRGAAAAAGDRRAC